MLCWSKLRCWAAAIIAALLCAAAFMLAQPEGKRITFYTAQTSYSLPVLERDGGEYIGLFEALEPIGSVSAKSDGKKWKLKFRDTDAQFEAGKSKARIRSAGVELTSPFVLDHGRGYVPIASLKALLPPLLSSPTDVRTASRRVFIGVTPVTLTTKKVDSGKVSFTFSAPVNPQIATEAGKLRMTFLREPLVSETSAMTFDDKTISRAFYTESNGAAELVVSSSAAVQASFSEDRKTITVTVLPASAPPLQVATTATTPAAPIATLPATTPKPRIRPAVLIDAAHGGDDRGATLTEKASEKDVTLAFARRLKHELELRGMEAALLRDSDATLNMDQRISAANTSGAMMYVAIHATASGSGIHLYTAMLPPQARKPLSFVRADSAQAPWIDVSRAFVVAMSTELLKRDTPVTSMPVNVAPLRSVLIPAVAAEIAPPPSGHGDDLATPAYQQSTAVAIANAIIAARTRLPQQEASR